MPAFIDQYIWYDLRSIFFWTEAKRELDLSSRDFNGFDIGWIWEGNRGSQKPERAICSFQLYPTSNQVALGGTWVYKGKHLQQVVIIMIRYTCSLWNEIDAFLQSWEFRLTLKVGYKINLYFDKFRLTFWHKQLFLPSRAVA